MLTRNQFTWENCWAFSISKSGVENRVSELGRLRSQEARTYISCICGTFGSPSFCTHNPISSTTVASSRDISMNLGEIGWSCNVQSAPLVEYSARSWFGVLPCGLQARTFDASCLPFLSSNSELTVDFPWFRCSRDTRCVAHCQDWWSQSASPAPGPTSKCIHISGTNLRKSYAANQNWPLLLLAWEFVEGAQKSASQRHRRALKLRVRRFILASKRGCMCSEFFTKTSFPFLIPCKQIGRRAFFWRHQSIKGAYMRLNAPVLALYPQGDPQGGSVSLSWV